MVVPIAAALKDNGAGQVYGIETWSGSAAVSYRTNIANDFWWMTVDFPKIKGDFLEFIVRHQLHDTIRVVEAASDKCPGMNRGPKFSLEEIARRAATVTS